MDDKIKCVETANGNKYWYKNGLLHRTDGPAVERADGNKSWWQNDKLHRTDGPAVERADGYKAWFLDHEKYSFSEWCDELNLSREEKCELVLIYG